MRGLEMVTKKKKKKKGQSEDDDEMDMESLGLVEQVLPISGKL